MHSYKLFKDFKENIKKKLDIKVIYTDMDGTMLNDRGCLIKDENGKYFFDTARLLEKIEKKGWDLVLVSGRSKTQLRYNSMMIGTRNFIPELGSEIVYDLGQESHLTFDMKKYKYDITRGGKDLLKIIEIFKKAFPGKVESRIEWSLGRSYNALFFGEIDTKKANRLLEDNGYEGLMIVNNGFSNLVTLDLDVEELRIYNLIYRGADKASAINLDRKIRKLKKNNCIALGDSFEDIKMAREVGVFFLMKNAIDRDAGIIDLIKNYDNIYVTEKSMNHGWLEVIDFLLE